VGAEADSNRSGPEGDRAPLIIDLARSFCRDGLCVQDGFLDAAELAALAASAEARFARGEFAPARIGALQETQRRDEIRGDSICWLAAPLCAAETSLLARLESLRLALNREGTLGLFDLELHYARYAPGAAYARHLDQPHDRKHRRVSLVLYLNVAWPAAAGGALRIYDADARYRDVAPRGGRLVLFSSADREHEVLAADRVRWSLAGWLRTRD
jgi:SM-20-related protein